MTPTLERLEEDATYWGLNRRQTLAYIVRVTRVEADRHQYQHELVMAFGKLVDELCLGAVCALILYGVLGVVFTLAGWL